MNQYLIFVLDYQLYETDSDFSKQDEVMDFAFYLHVQLRNIN